MTEILSTKSDRDFTDGVKGLAKNPDSEGDVGMFDALFGVVSQEEMQKTPEVALLPSNLIPSTNEIETDAQDTVVLANMPSNFQDNELSKGDKNNLNKSKTPNNKWLLQNPFVGKETAKLTLEIKKNDNNSNFLNELATVVRRNNAVVSEQNKKPVLEEKNVEALVNETKSTKKIPYNNNDLSQKLTKIIPENVDKSDVDKDKSKNKDSLSNSVNPILSKIKNELLNSEADKLSIKNSEKGFQVPKFLQSSSDKEILKVDAGQNSSVPNSSVNSSMSNNTNSGGNLNSGSSSHSNPNAVLEHLNMLDKSWSKNLLSKVQSALQKGNETIEIALKPKNLGRLRINLSLNNEGAKVNIVTETTSAALLLSEAESKLSQMLEGSGLKLTNLNTSSEQGKKGKSEHNKNEKDLDEKGLGNKSTDPEEVKLISQPTKSQNYIVNYIA